MTTIEVHNAGDWLKAITSLYEQSGQTKSAAHFTLTHGKEYTDIMPFDEVIQAYGPGSPRNCYGDALELATFNDDLTYVEGTATSGLCYADHAWVVDQTGLVIDTTWAANWQESKGKYGKQEQRHYFGFEVDTEVLDQWVSLTGYTGILGNIWSVADLVIEHGMDVVRDPHSCAELIALIEKSESVA